MFQWARDDKLILSSISVYLFPFHLFIFNFAVTFKVILILKQNINLGLEKFTSKCKSPGQSELQTSRPVGDGCWPEMYILLSEKKTVPSTIEKFDGKSRAYIEIQQGCDHRCTFCIIPYGRGNNRSVPAGEIVERIKKIV